MDYLLRGILIGLLFGLPVGAVGTMTVQRTWNNGIKAGLFTGLGSSASDCFYAAAGVFGITLISDFLLKYQVIINILGGGFILYMGIRLLIKKDEAAPQNEKTAGALKMFLSSFAVGITNPAAILTFLFAFSYLGISAGAGLLQGFMLYEQETCQSSFSFGLCLSGYTGESGGEPRYVASHPTLTQRIFVLR